MPVLVFGKTGQVAREIARTMPDAVCLARDEADLGEPEACAALIARSGWDAVINAAAYTAVDRAETDAAAAQMVNGAAPAAMARACAAKNLPFVHISTDYVFDGAGLTPFTPDTPAAPLGVYGCSKLAGETGIRAARGHYAILRTSWVFSAHGSNFVRTMLRLAADRKTLNVVSDQTGGPTAAADIARAVAEITKTMVAGGGVRGIYHYAGAPDVSWADFAREIFRQTRHDTIVHDIPTAEFPTPARRPLNSRLDCTGTERVFGLERPDWKAALRRVLDELGAIR